MAETRIQSNSERETTDSGRETQVCPECGGKLATDAERGETVYRRALEEDLLPGRSIEGVATAALYAAARQTNTPRSLDEVAAVSRIDEMEFTRTYRYVVRELDLAVQPADPENYVRRFASELDVGQAAEQRAHDLLRAGKEEGIDSGKSPVGLAAAAIYAGALLVDEEPTQQEVGEVADVSEVTIRNRYQELLVARDTDVDARSVG